MPPRLKPAASGWSGPGTAHPVPLSSHRAHEP